MSMSTWKKEFYPIDASKIKTEKGAIKHSLRKWEGLLQKNLKKHKMTASHRYHLEDENDNRLRINGDSCALCRLINSKCNECPIVKCGFGPCDWGSDNNDGWRRWIDNDDPKPMIKLLKKVLKKYEEQSK